MALFRQVIVEGGRGGTRHVWDLLRFAFKIPRHACTLSDEVRKKTKTRDFNQAYFLEGGARLIAHYLVQRLAYLIFDEFSFQLFRDFNRGHRSQVFSRGNIDI